jgi:hypothetical protein
LDMLIPWLSISLLSSMKAVVLTVEVVGDGLGEDGDILLVS